MKFKGQKGFSLVEVMIVIAILAILLAIAVPSFQRFAINSDLRSAARDIAGDFFLCKERAIAENATYTITFNVGANTYAIVCPDTRTKTPATFRPNNIVLQSASTTAYTFQPRGTVTAGNIALTNSRNSTATITINITGRTSVAFTMQ